MQLTITKSSQETIQIELPYYRKGTAHFFKVVSENSCIRIQEMISACSISSDEFVSLAFQDGISPCTEQEFNEAYGRVSERLRSEAAFTISTSPIPPQNIKVW